MRVTLVTTWGIACGIAEHAFYLKEAIEGADRDIQIDVQSNLHPDAWGKVSQDAPLEDWVWLNYHAALHSQWTPRHVQRVQSLGTKVGITYHDSGVPNSDQCKALHAVADVFVIHEPAEDLPGVVYLRQGIPDWGYPWEFDRTSRSWCGRRPIVGTLGFPFPWKGFDLLVEASALAGWACLLVTANPTGEQVGRWQALNPHLWVESGFTHRDTALAMLSACDATAFLYANANTGTSAAIRLGIAARKPVIATAMGGCRQFRDLYLDPVGSCAINWVHKLDVQEVASALACVRPGPFDAGMVHLAHQDSWASRGQVYAKLLRGEAL